MTLCILCSGTLFWVDSQAIVKYSMNTSSASNVGPELKQPNHLTKDAATNRLYVQVLYDGSKEWIQSFNFNGEQLNVSVIIMAGSPNLY